MGLALEDCVSVQPPTHGEVRHPAGLHTLIGPVPYEALFDHCIDLCLCQQAQTIEFGREASEDCLFFLPCSANKRREQQQYDRRISRRVTPRLHIGCERFYLTPPKGMR